MRSGLEIARPPPPLPPPGRPSPPRPQMRRQHHAYAPRAAAATGPVGGVPGVRGRAQQQRLGRGGARGGPGQGWQAASGRRCGLQGRKPIVGARCREPPDLRARRHPPTSLSSRPRCPPSNPAPQDTEFRLWGTLANGTSCAFKSPEGDPLYYPAYTKSSWGGAPACAKAPTDPGAFATRDAQGRLWGWEGEAPCAYKPRGARPRPAAPKPSPAARAPAAPMAPAAEPSPLPAADAAPPPAAGPEAVLFGSGAGGGGGNASAPGGAASCPDGSAPVACIQAPCAAVRCAAGYSCIEDLCGGCNAWWVLAALAWAPGGGIDCPCARRLTRL
jgi:hypothetical protein